MSHMYLRIQRDRMDCLELSTVLLLNSFHFKTFFDDFFTCLSGIC